MTAPGYLLPPLYSRRMSAVRSMSGRVARVRNGNSGSSPGISLQRNIVADSARTHPSVNGENRPEGAVSAPTASTRKQTLAKLFNPTHISTSVQQSCPICRLLY
jgi:hypothetical protein